MLLKLLQEASTLRIEDVKKAIKKDSRVSAILGKEAPRLDSIGDKDAFLSTIKYLLLNNSNVLEFVKRRDNVAKFSKKSDFDPLRKARSKDLTQELLDDLHAFVKALFSEHASVDRGSMSSALRKELSDWVNHSGRYYNLPLWAMNELKTIDAVKPSKKVVLYRGLLFKDYDLSETKSYNGTLEEGNGLKFLKSIRAGKRTVDLTWDRPSSWSTSKATAEQFAKYGPASSSFSATFQWLERGVKAIDGAIGFVISVHADPADVLIDMSKANIRSGYTDESEMILAPGTYLARVVKKFTVDGEVDLSAETLTDASTVTELYNSVKQKLGHLSAVEAISLDKTVWSSYNSLTNILANRQQLITVVRDSTTTSLMHDLNNALKILSEVAKIDDKTLRADNYVDQPQVRRMAKALSSLKNGYALTKYKQDSNKSAHELTAEEIRRTLIVYQASQLEQLLVANRPLTSSTGRDAVTALRALAKMTDADFPETFVKMGIVKQTQIANTILNSAAKNLGIDKESETDTSKLMIDIIKRLSRNLKIMALLSQIKQSIRIENEDK